MNLLCPIHINTQLIWHLTRNDSSKKGQNVLQKPHFEGTTCDPRGLPHPCSNKHFLQSERIDTNASHKCDTINTQWDYIYYFFIKFVEHFKN